jgi:hypothetical protein
MEPQDLSSEELEELLKKRIRVFATLEEEERKAVAAFAREQIARRMPFDFVLSSARTLARQKAAEAEEEEHPGDLERRQFIEANALPPEERVSARSQPRREAKAREREALAARIRELLREARSARQPHERKRMRRMLLGVDQAKLRRSLGREGQRLVEEIQALLLQSADLR